MSATPFAEQIYPTVKQTLLTIQNISQQKHVFDPTSLRSLKIAVHDEVEPIILPRLKQHFQNLVFRFTVCQYEARSKTYYGGLGDTAARFRD